QTSQRMIADLIRNQGQIDREKNVMLGGASIEQALANRGDSVAQNLNNVNAAWNNLLQVVAGENNENIVKLLRTLADVVNTMKEIAHDHPDAVKGIAVGLAALAAVFVTAGVGAMMLAIGTGGWLIAGIVALGGAFAYLKANGSLDTI